MPTKRVIAHCQVDNQPVYRSKTSSGGEEDVFVMVNRKPMCLQHFYDTLAPKLEKRPEHRQDELLDPDDIESAGRITPHGGCQCPID